MNNSYDLTLDRLMLIETNAGRIANLTSDQNIQGHLAEIQDAAKEVRTFLNENKARLEDKAPLGIYKSGLH